METISPEALKKALSTLGLDPEEATSDVPAAEAAVVEDTELQKAEKAVALAQAKLEEIKNPGAQVLNKAEIIGELNKASNDKFKAIATIMKSKDDKIDKLEKAIESMVNFNEILGKRLGIIEKTPMPAKAIRGNVAVIERFAKGGDPENGENGSPEPLKVPVFSLSNQKQRGKVASMLMTELKKSFAAHGETLDEDDKKLQKSIAQVEIGNVSDQARDLIHERLKIRLVR